MKKPHVLNRAMFNRGGTSAYGRGITSNLVTEEQRQRFNYGGRVGFRYGRGVPKIDYRMFEGNRIPLKYLDQDYAQEAFTPAVKNWWDMSGSDSGIPSVEELQEEEYYGPLGDYKPYQIGTATGVRGSENPILARGTGEKGDVWFGDVGEEVQEFPDGDLSKISRASELVENRKAAKERALDVPIIDQNIRSTEEDNIPGEIMADSDTMDWESIYEPTPEQKRRTKGEGQLGLAAAALDVFSQPTIAKGMKAASPHLLNLGKTATADQKARDKAILQGKVLSKVYGEREKAKGEEARKTAAEKAGGDTPSNLFWGILDAAQIKKGKAKDVDYAYAYERASKKPTQIIKKEEDKAAIEANPDQFKDTVFVMGSSFLKINKKTGRLEDITKEVFESFKG